MRADEMVAADYFFDFLMPCIVGNTTWTASVKKLPLSKFVSPTTEAYAYLLLECNYGVVVNNDRHKKWSGGSRSNGSNASWETKAVDRFEEILNQVLADREANASFDDEYLKRKTLKHSILKLNEGGLAPAGGKELVSPKKRPRWKFPTAGSTNNKPSERRAQL